MDLADYIYLVNNCLPTTVSQRRHCIAIFTFSRIIRSIIFCYLLLITYSQRTVYVMHVVGDLIYGKKDICASVYSDGQFMTKRSHPDYLKWLQYASCGEVMSCDGPITKHSPGCYCMPGYVRSNGTCVPKTTCSEPSSNPLNLRESM